MKPSSSTITQQPKPVDADKPDRPVEPTSVYVSNLPKDITEEEISTSISLFSCIQSSHLILLCMVDILFSPQGKVKKVKIYLDDRGQPKGDALVTFHRPEAAQMACFKVVMHCVFGRCVLVNNHPANVWQLNRLDIGEGFVIAVTKADFSNKTSTNSSKDAGLDWMNETLLLQSLEMDGSFGSPWVVVWNAFEADQSDLLEVEVPHALLVSY